MVPARALPMPPRTLKSSLLLGFVSLEGWTGANCSVLDLEPVPDAPAPALVPAAAAPQAGPATITLLNEWLRVEINVGNATVASSK